MMMLSAALLLVGCAGNEYEDWASPQSNEAEESIVVPGFSASAVDVINLNNISLSNEKDVRAFTLSGTLPDGFTLTVAKMIFDNAELSADPDGMVSSQALQDFFSSLYGVRPVEREARAEVILNAIVNGVATNINAGVITVKAIPQAPELENTYYITGTVNGWNNSDKSYPVVNGGGDPYEDPVFKITIPVGDLQGGTLEFKLTPESGIGGDWSKCLCSADEAGKFNYNNVGGNFLVPAPPRTAKYVRLTFNMLDQTWTYDYISFEPFIYFIGATDGWANAEQKLALTNDNGTYTGYIYCADPNGWGNEFKFQRVAGSWDNEINYSTFSGGVSGDFTQGGGTNFKANAGEGVYYVVADLAALTLTGTYITNMNLVGDFNGWNPGDDAQQMTWDAANYCYVIRAAGVTANGWKFTANNDWGINLGGNDTVEPSMVINDLVGNGKNLGVVGTTIKLYPTRKTSDKIYCTVE